jgi:hypothetical protein
MALCVSRKRDSVTFSDSGGNLAAWNMPAAMTAMRERLAGIGVTYGNVTQAPNELKVVFDPAKATSEEVSELGKEIFRANPRR